MQWFGMWRFQCKAVSSAEPVRNLCCRQTLPATQVPHLELCYYSKHQFGSSSHTAPQCCRQQHKNRKGVTHWGCPRKLLRGQQANLGCQEQTLRQAHVICSGASLDLTSAQSHCTFSLEAGGGVCTHLWSLTTHVQNWMSTKQDEPTNWVKHNSQNYWAFVSIRLFL